jgi:hypothetical protein
MKEMFDNKLVGSFLLYIENKILSKGEAYTNVSTLLYPAATHYTNQITYNSPYRQWVMDSSISGANIPTGIYVTGSLKGRGYSGLQIDFYNGRAIFTGQVGAGAVSGNYAIKDFNVYYTTEQSEQLLFESKFELIPKYPQLPTGVAEGVKTYPVIYVKYNQGENTPRAYGGEDETKGEFRCIVLADTAFKLDAICSIIRDSTRDVFPILPSQELPYNEYGDIKNIAPFNTGANLIYNYNELIKNKAGYDLILVNRVRISKFREQVNTLVHPGMVGAFCDVEVVSARWPRQ